MRHFWLAMSGLFFSAIVMNVWQIPRRQFWAVVISVVFYGLCVQAFSHPRFR